MENNNLSPLPKPLEEVAGTLSSASHEPEEMRGDVKAAQRTMLLEKARASFAKPEKAPTEHGSFRSWFSFSAFTFVAAAAVFVLMFTVARQPQGVISLARIDQINRLLIPAANASQAFTVTSEDSSFVLRSRLPLSLDQVKQTVKIDPPVDMDIVAIDAKTFRLTPHVVLASDQVYRVALPAVVKNADGTEVAHDFSWALAPKDLVRVVSTIPADSASGVPVDTGIEFTLNHEGVQNTANAIEMTPAVDGHVEVHGRSIVFVPSKPLAVGTRYEARLKQGLKLADSDLSLQQDKRVRFETQATTSQAISPVFSLNTEFLEVLPGEDVQLPVYQSDPSMSGTDLDVTGFALSIDQAKQLLTDRLSVPVWASVERSSFAAYERVATNQAWHMTTKLGTPGQGGAGVLTLPKQTQSGFFVVKVQSGTQIAWLFLQVTPVATYTVADKDTLLMWAVNGVTKKPLPQLAISLDGTNAITDDHGIARLSSPAFLSATTSAQGDAPRFAIATVNAGSLQALAVIQSSFRPFFDNAAPSALATTWGYLYADRPLYHPTDDVEFFGLVQDRGTHVAPTGQTVVRITSPGWYFDMWSGRAKVYAETPVTLDVAGRFEGKLHWDSLLPGYYTLELLRDGKVVTNRSIEVREFVKPAYGIQVQTTVGHVYGGEEVKGTIVARFYDGTPVPRATLSLHAQQRDVLDETQDITLDESGVASFTLKTAPVVCGTQLSDECRAEEVLNIDVRPKVGEEGEIVGTAGVRIFGSELDIRMDVQTTSGTARLAVQTYHRNTNVTLEDQTTVGVAWPGRTLKGAYVGHQFVAVQDGTYYDFIEKKVKPAVHFDRKDDAPIFFDVTTDASGRGSFAFRMDPTRDYYDVAVQGQDLVYRYARMTLSVGPGWYERGMGYNRNDAAQLPSLVFPNKQSSQELSVGETARVTYQHGTTPLATDKTPGVLFVVASRGMKDAVLSSGPTYDLAWKEELIPNAEIRAVTWLDNRFEDVRATAFAKRDDSALVIEAKISQASYAPGGTVLIHVTAKDKISGQPVKDVRLAYSAIDRALLSLSDPGTEDAQSSLYQSVSDGILVQSPSHSDVFNMMGGGGAEMGGYPMAMLDKSASVRRIFKDTAAFGIVSLNELGEGDVIFTAPDNLTSWKVTLVGLSADLHVGVGSVEAAVTKPVFVEAVLPPRLLTNDKPVLKVRAFGTGVPAGALVDFSVNAPTLGLNNVHVTGTSGVATYIGISRLTPGTHELTIGLTMNGQQDAIAHTVDVVDSRFLKDEFVSLPATPGATLPELGAPEADVLIMGTGRAAFVPRVYGLLWGDSARLDARVATKVALGIIKDRYHNETSDQVDPSLDGYQDLEGGLKLLPYASTDVVLSSEVAATAPDMVDTQMLSTFFQNVLTSSSTREEQIEALAGLASLGKPVLLDLKAIAKQTDLSLQEKLLLVRGFVGAGDKDNAQTLFDEVLAKAVRQDAVMYLPVSQKPADIYAATAEAAALSAELGRSEANLFAQYVDSNWAVDAFPVLAKARYLKSRIAALPIADGSVSWTVNGGAEETLNLKEESVKVITLTRDEAKTFRVTKVSGPAVLEFVRRTPGRPVSVPGISLSRTYQAPHALTELQEGDLVKITLTPTWFSTIQDGCYLVRDHLPGGWQAVGKVGVYQTTDLSYPYQVLNGEVSFIGCKPDPASSQPPVTFSYLARVVSRGTYNAEAPLMQHMEYSSVAVLGTDAMVIVK